MKGRDFSAKHESSADHLFLFFFGAIHSLPQNYMFQEMRAALGIPRSVDILDHIRSLSNEPDTGTSAEDNDILC